MFDIGKLYSPPGHQDLLVRDSRLGSGLAAEFRASKEDSSAGNTGESLSPDHAVVLMRRHGYTTHGKDIETAVYRAIYTKVNASVQTNAMLLRSAMPSFGPNMDAKFDLEPLTDDMCRGCLKMNEGTQDKPWRLWAAEVEKSSLYVNRG